ncbi:MAG: hypothetical protein HKN30_00715 [Sulfitobacter sp.]|nr:hypothetical protein [Sulfitobacter sp.]
MNPRFFASLSLCALLAGCGSNTDQEGLLAPIQASLSGLIGGGPPVTDAATIRAALTPEVRAQFGNRPLKIAVLEKSKQASLLIESERNRDVVTFITPDGATVSLRSGVIVATRGLGFDLMSADVSDVTRALRNGGGDATRIHRYLDGEDQVVILSLVCDIVGGATLTETCYGDGIKITNTYRGRGTGTYAASRQWIGPERGYLRLEPAE